MSDLMKKREEGGSQESMILGRGKMKSPRRRKERSWQTIF